MMSMVVVECINCAEFKNVVYGSLDGGSLLILVGCSGAIKIELKIVFADNFGDIELIGLANVGIISL